MFGQPTLVRMQKRKSMLDLCVSLQFDGTLGVVPYQILELETALNIHTNRLSGIDHRVRGKVQTRYRLDKWPKAGKS